MILNGGNPVELNSVTVFPRTIGDTEGKSGELKHLSSRVKRKKIYRFCEKWRAKTEEPKPCVRAHAGVDSAYMLQIHELAERSWYPAREGRKPLQRKNQFGQQDPEYQYITRET